MKASLFILFFSFLCLFPFFSGKKKEEGGGLYGESRSITIFQKSYLLSPLLFVIIN